MKEVPKSLQPKETQHRGGVFWEDFLHEQLVVGFGRRLINDEHIHLF